MGRGILTFWIVGAVVLAGVISACEKPLTREEYWRGDGAKLIEKAKVDEAAAWKRIEVATTAEERQGALMTAQLMTAVRKRYEDTRDGKPHPPDSN